ncbi:hypothetical protein Bca101_049799 [Brassica carinata]
MKIAIIHTSRSWYRHLSSNGVWFFPATSYFLPSTRNVCIFEVSVVVPLLKLKRSSKNKTSSHLVQPLKETNFFQAACVSSTHQRMNISVLFR